MAEHTVRAFDIDIDRLRGLVAEMGGRCEAAIGKAMVALTKYDTAAAEEVIAEDKAIDAMELEIERLAIQIIALRAPMADDLREAVAALKVASVLERIGDYSKNIAKRSMKIGKLGKIDPIVLIPAMADVAREMVREALDAFAARSASEAVAVCEKDEKVDNFYDAIFRALITHMVENPQTIGNVAHLLFVAKNLERIGDHATNVAEMVYYVATGTYLAEDDQEDD